ncbi:MAG: tRNA epoxyqueuosine(34) reductase QueG, partial [Bacteroidaceae bacterium]|nr:tRNA epoxyqueuosine(34) reductase QueG [Bacteroidaceae bacterium]
CIKACPWNRFASPTREEGLMPNEAFMNMTPADWENLDVETYRKIFKGSAVKRAKFEGLQRNIKCVLDNLKRKKQ